MQKLERSRTIILMILSILCLVLITSASAQQADRYSLSGIIFDTSTREPLPFVNVFLASTALGAVTDTAGRFFIEKVPIGAYDLIISNPGYDREIRRIEIQQQDLTSIRIALREKVIETTPVEIVGEEPSVWRERLSRFEKKFFGTTRNGKSCTILNPEVLEFSVDPGTDRFEASASAPLLIENRALGYRIEFILRFFIIDGRLLKISGWPRFEELDGTNEEQLTQWKEERQRAYDGSLRHFLVALVNGRLKQEGFRISLVREITSGSGMSLVPDEQLREQIITLGPLSFERQLSFEDYLKVDYFRAFQEAGFESYWKEILGLGRGFSDGHQFSWLRLAVRPAMLSAEGLPYDSSLLETYGYWAFERVGEWVPLEYRP